YPQILAGGWVCQPSGSAACGTSGGKAVIDSTREIIGMLDAEQQKDTPFCLHARHAMTPIGQRLRKVDSVAELVIVLNDAMVCHDAINKRCGILHRDISANNILVVREKDKPVRGMLIDFDCAIVESDKSASIRPERTGTLPFMSIANLERMDIQRTVLDDWESLLYLVCWLATFGIKSDNDREDESVRLPISSWSSDSPSITAQAKRNHLASAESFRGNILKHFQEGQDPMNVLGLLARGLHESLFFNENLDEKARTRCHGTWDIPIEKIEGEKTDFKKMFAELNVESDHESTSTINPFSERIQHSGIIVQDLLAVLAGAAEWASKPGNQSLFPSK
ncbi:hypothetical protein GGI25_003661, partial [Coemansia spiralis]